MKNQGGTGERKPAERTAATVKQQKVLCDCKWTETRYAQ